MLVEKVTAGTMSSGLVRISCVRTGPDGKEIDAGEILIPAARLTGVMRDLDTALRQIAATAKERVDAAKAELAARGESFDSPTN
jgi:hypothetical protein